MAVRNPGLPHLKQLVLEKGRKVNTFTESKYITFFKVKKVVWALTFKIKLEIIKLSLFSFFSSKYLGCNYNYALSLGINNKRSIDCSLIVLTKLCNSTMKHPLFCVFFFSNPLKSFIFAKIYQNYFTQRLLLTLWYLKYSQGVRPPAGLRLPVSSLV